MPIMAPGCATMALDTLTMRPQSSLEHGGQHREAERRGGDDVDGDGGRPLVWVDRDARTERPDDGGVVDEDVDRSQLFVRVPATRATSLWSPRSARTTSAPPPSSFTRSAVSSSSSPERATKATVDAGLGELKCDRPPDAASGSGH